MRYISLCSGIEAATRAWEPLGWTPVAFSEIAPFPSAVLAHHYPDVPNLGDMTKVDWSQYAGAADLVCGGTPCQSFSVAGLRKGLADPRGNLALEFLRAVDAIRPEWVVWENVPGVLSSGSGRDFGTFLGALGQLGYGFAYRVLDAQYVRVDGFGRAVPQRRRRVFVVGCAGGAWQRAAAVLLERESLSWGTAPSRRAGAGVAGTLEARTCRSVGAQDAGAEHIVAEPLTFEPSITGREGGHVYRGVSGTIRADAGDNQMAVCFAENQRGELRTSEVAMSLSCAGGKPGSGYPAVLYPEVAHTLVAGGRETGPHGALDGVNLVVHPEVTHSLTAEGFDASEDGTGRGTPIVCLAQSAANAEVTEDYSPTLTCTHDGPPIMCVPDVAGTLRAEGDQHSCFRDGEGLVPILAAVNWRVRRLTPRECERLQGFPDDYTLVPYRKGMAADGPRYKAIGNSWAVNVARWVGTRIEMVREVEAAA